MYVREEARAKTKNNCVAQSKDAAKYIMHSHYLN
jgi:hypothetical protein